MTHIPWFDTISRMTISESLQAQWRRGQIIMNTVGVIPILIFVVAVFTGVGQRVPGTVIAWFLGTAMVAIAVWIVIGFRLRCPICGALVGKSMKRETLLHTCPQCKADFSQPMPSNAA